MLKEATAVTAAETIKPDTRNYGIDLLRIVSMFMVCVLHVLGAGGVLDATKPFGANYIIGWFLESATFCAVNCYALISGYVGVNAKHKYAGIVNLWLQVAFYSVLITVLFSNFLPQFVTNSEIVKAVFPVSMGQYWYFTAYFCLFFVMPVFNTGIKAMPKPQLRGVLIVMFVLLTILPGLANRDIFSVMNGYSVFWLAYLYCVGAYIHIHGIEKNAKPWLCFAVFLLCALLTFLSKAGAAYLGLGIEGFLLSYISPTVTVAAIALFLLFARARITRGRGLIRFFAPLSFSVFLIHTHPLIFANILWGAFAFLAAKSSLAFMGGVFLAALCIHIGCSLIDVLRVWLFKLLRLQKATAWIENKLTKH